MIFSQRLKTDLSTLPFLAILLLLLVSLAGCADPGMNDLEEYANQIKARRPPPIDPLPEFAVAESFQYDPVQRRDPFILDRETAAIMPAPPDPSGIAPDPNRPKEILERCALDSLIMRGIMQQDEGIWGLVLNKEDKTLYRVGVGNYLGQNHGRIIRISEQRIDLIELVQDSAGRWMEREASIALMSDQGANK